MKVNSKKYYAALDLSGPCSSFSLFDVEDKKVVETKSILLSNRNNFSFFNVLFCSLKQNNIELEQISEWFVGIGPGSFTGLRIASSFVSGIIYAKDNIKVNAIPSVFPLAAKVNSIPNDRIAVLYYASRGEALIYSIENKDGTLVSKKEPILVGKDNISSEFENFEHIAFMDNKFIAEILPERKNFKVNIFESYPAELLFLNKYIHPQYSLKDLIYVRPATIS